MDRGDNQPVRRPEAREPALKQGWSKPLNFGIAHQTVRSLSSDGGHPLHAADFPALPSRSPLKLPAPDNGKNSAGKLVDGEDQPKSSGPDVKHFPTLGGKATKPVFTSTSGLRVTAPEFKPRGNVISGPPTSPEKLVSGAGKSQRFDLSSVLQTPADTEPRSSDAEPTSTESVKPPVKERKERVITGRNLLDSSAPKTLRGKEKASPKPKKTSAMKRAILENRQRRIQTESLDSFETTQTSPEGCVNGVSKDVSTTAEKSPSLSDDTAVPQPSSETREPVICKFCDHEITPEMISLAENILDSLVFYQNRAHKQDPLMFKRRFVCGLKDVDKHLETREVKLIFVASNIEEGVGQHGPDQKLQTILRKAKERKVPVVFVMNKRKLGKRCRKPAHVSMVGVYNYDVAVAGVRKLLELADSSREEEHRNKARNSGTGPTFLQELSDPDNAELPDSGRPLAPEQ